MKKAKILLKSLFFGALVLVTSCSDDDTPEQGVHHDEITTVEVTVTDGDGVATVYNIHGEHEDHDKVGNKNEDDEDEVEIELYANSTYTVSVRFLNDEDPNDIEDATEEILEEKDEHFIVFSKEEGVNLTIARTDDASSTRADGNKIGLSSTWTTGAASPEGHVEVKLYHEPTSVSEAVTGNGNDFGSVGAGSETDIEVHFAVIIEQEPV